MDGADVNFVDMETFLKKSGDFIASFLDVEAAYVTAGCYAAMVLSSAGSHDLSASRKAGSTSGYHGL